MPSAIVVGSGVAAAGAALALARRSDLAVTVIDIGTRLESGHADAVERLRAGAPLDWDAADLALVAAQPVASSTRGLPEKRIYGSDYPFRNVGQLDGLAPSRHVHDALVSGAYGGFSNVWGSQFMPFSAPTFATWPFAYGDLEPHYRAILGHVPLAGEQDDLAGRFPLISPTSPLPPVSDRTTRVLDSYRRHRPQLQRLGVTVGKARLAFRAAECTRCGLCMTGCPYGLIYSAAHTFDDLRRVGRVTYHGGLMALTVEEDEHTATVVARGVAGGGLQRFTADRVFLACGTFGTTRIAMSSLQMFDMAITLSESVQFAIPMLSARATPDPRTEPQFTLNQFNMVVALDEAGRDLSQLHFYTYNTAFVDALPSALRAERAAPLLAQVLRRTSVALGYIPSWGSPRLHLTVRRARDGGVPQCALRRDPIGLTTMPMLRRVLARVSRAARGLDLYPVLPRLAVAAGGKSYHCGSSFPHRVKQSRSTPGSDRLGRVGTWERIHIVDGSVFPDVPATTFGFTAMANAHRIASESMELSW